MMLIAENIKFYPDEFQINIIETTFGAARRLYNCLHAQYIERREMSYEERKSHVYKNYTSIKNTWNNDENWLNKVAGQSLANAEMNYKKAWNNFNKNKSHFKTPTFKHKNTSKKSYSLNNNTVKNDIRIDKDNNKLLKIPKLGLIKLSKKIRFNNYIIKKITIMKSSTNKYYVSILMEIEQDELKYKYMKSNTSNKIGIDLGLTDIVVDSNGNKICNPKHLKKYEKKLIKEQQSLSRKYESAKKDKRKLIDSKNYQKQKLKVAKIHEKIRNQRIDFLNKLSNTITNENQVIIVEDLKIENMIKNGHLSKSISDVAWGTLVSQIEYKSMFKDRTFVKIDTFFPSSKKCSNCGIITKDVVNSLSIREWECPECRAHHDRDINAAINILNQGLTLIDK